MRYILLVLVILVGCTESALHQLPEITPEEIVTSPDGVDVLIVLDTSCSMQADWATITYGLGRSLDDLATTTDVFGRVTSACPGDDVLYPVADGWDLMPLISDVRRESCHDEAGLSSAIDKKGLDWYSDGTRADTWAANRPDVVVFVSDEPDQSPFGPDEFLAQWSPDWVTAVVGPDYMPLPGSGCPYEAGHGYLDIADKAVPICTTTAWSVF